MKDLLDERATLAVYDPQMTREQMMAEFDYTLPGMDKMMSTCTMLAIHGAHAIAVMTGWDEFATLDFDAVYATMSKPAS